MSLQNWFLSTTLCTLFSLFTIPFEQGAAQFWRFDDEKVGELPRGFSSEAGEWKVVAKPSGDGNALAQRARSEGRVFNVALVRDTSYRDVEVSVELQADAGKIDQGGGVVWRARDGKNYYIARYNPLENNLRVYKVVDGARTQLATADVPGDRDWHALRITMAGSLMECFFDGRKHLEARDGTFSDAGMIGTWTKADAQTLFDNLSVKALRNTR